MIELQNQISLLLKAKSPKSKERPSAFHSAQSQSASSQCQGAIAHCHAYSRKDHVLKTAYSLQDHKEKQGYRNEEG